MDDGTGDLPPILGTQVIQCGRYVRKIVPIVVEGRDAAGNQLPPQKSEVIPDVIGRVIPVDEPEADCVRGKGYTLESASMTTIFSRPRVTWSKTSLWDLESNCSA